MQQSLCLKLVTKLTGTLVEILQVIFYESRRKACTRWYCNVMNGGSLTIEPGTEIFSSFETVTSYLSIHQVDEIHALGTKEAPIVFSTIRKVTSIHNPEIGVVL